MYFIAIIQTMNETKVLTLPNYINIFYFIFNSSFLLNVCKGKKYVHCVFDFHIYVI